MLSRLNLGGKLGQATRASNLQEDSPDFVKDLDIKLNLPDKVNLQRATHPSPPPSVVRRRQRLGPLFAGFSREETGQYHLDYICHGILRQRFSFLVENQEGRALSLHAEEAGSPQRGERLEWWLIVD